MKKAASIRITPNQSALVTLGRALMATQIQLAERRGYIERIHEVEARGRPPVEGEVIPDGIEKLKRMMAYSPEREASAIIDVMSPDLLDKVLGKPDVPRED